jgi:Flp pilus assembly protein TadG
MDRSRQVRRDPEEGQTLVEFALVFTLFFTLVMAVMEFGLLYNNILTIQFASRQGVSMAAEMGAEDGADCQILKAVEAALQTPLNRSDVQAVEIFEADSAGNAVTGRVNRYVRSGTLACPGSSATQPYTLSGTEGYPEQTRTETLAEGLDMVGVHIDFTYHGITPIGALRTWALADGATLRMEPKQ